MKAYCTRCNRETETVFLPLSSGLIGNCCATCRACRKGKPYVSRGMIEHNTNHDARLGQGVKHEAQSPAT
ncbi:MAG: hypothetical protein WCI95_05550 [bacterium]